MWYSYVYAAFAESGLGKIAVMLGAGASSGPVEYLHSVQVSKALTAIVRLNVMYGQIVLQPVKMIDHYFKAWAKIEIFSEMKKQLMTALVGLMPVTGFMICYLFFLL